MELPAVRDFVEKHLNARRGHATRILHLGRDELSEPLGALLGDPSWTCTAVTETAGADGKGDAAFSEVAPRSVDVVISTEAFDGLDFPWVSALELARVLRPDGLACIAISSEARQGTTADRWRSPLDDTVELIEWADLESIGVIVSVNPNQFPGPMVVARRPKLAPHRELLGRAKLFALRALSVRQAYRRARHFGIRRGQRRRDAGRLLLSASDRDRARPRGDYKQAWQDVSHDAFTATVSVAGHADETLLQTTADQTVQVLRDTTGLKPDDVVLEIGAGVGRVGPAIAPLVRRWIAADVSSNMLDQARERCAGLDNVEFVEISGWDLAPVDDASVDLVYCTIVFPHLDEWDRFSYVVEAMRVLRPEGRLYVDNVNLLSEPGWTFFTDMLESYHPLDRPPNVSKTSTPEELGEYLRRAGFVDVVTRGAPDVLWASAFGVKPS
jgi:SAM-dependent methyltransferase